MSQDMSQDKVRCSAILRLAQKLAENPEAERLLKEAIRRAQEVPEDEEENKEGVLENKDDGKPGK